MAERAPGASALYPFLHGAAAGADAAALLESVQRKADDSVAAKRTFFGDHGEALVAAARTIADVYRAGRRMYAMGNGGSSCDAAHFAVEFQHPVTVGRPALPALNLCADTAMLTAVGNDVGNEQIFARQVIALGTAGDGLIGFSTSGNSPNLNAAFVQARRMGLRTLALVGGDGGALARSADIEHCLVVATDSIHRVQEVHVAAYHILWDLVHTLLAASGDTR